MYSRSFFDHAERRTDLTAKHAKGREREERGQWLNLFQPSLRDIVELLIPNFPSVPFSRYFACFAVPSHFKYFPVTDFVDFRLAR